MTDHDHATRLAVADTIEAALDDLPPLKVGQGWHSYTETFHQRRAALADLSEELTQSYGARIKIDATACRMSLLGISTTCTQGLDALFRNWIAAARRLAEVVPEDEG